MLYAEAHAQTRATLFTPAAAVSKSGALAGALKDAIKREKSVNINFQHIAPDGAAAKEIDLELFDGQRVTLTMVRVERRSATNYTWYGHVKSVPSNNVTLTVVDKQVVGSLYIGQTANGPMKHYELQSDKGGAYTLREIDDSRMPDDSKLHNAAPKVFLLAQPRALLAAGAPSISTAEKKIDVLVAYTNQVATATGGNPGAAIQSAIDSANLTFSNTQLANTRVRLVGTMQVNYNETGMTSTDIQAIAGNAALNSQRNSVGADVVMVLAETMKNDSNQAICGQAGAIGAQANSALAMVARTCATTSLSFVHEMGHLFGARHDVAQDPTNAPYPYGHGFVDLTFKQYSVMAYGTTCTNAGVTGCIRYNVFSSPLLALNGHVFGDANSADNRRVLVENAQRLAGFYASNSLQERGVYTAPLSSYAINQVGTSTSFTVTSSTGSEPAVTYDNLSANRLQFADATVALDINGPAGKVFRLYQAAFNRKPDLSGLGFWIAQADRGTAMKDIAASFIASAEFINLYGANPSNESFVTSLYNNVLHRAPDPSGYAYWVNVLNTNAATRAEVLASMSESAENISGVAPSLTHGIQYTRYNM